LLLVERVKPVSGPRPAKGRFSPYREGRRHHLYGWFTEGFDAPDLREAKALVDEVG
jgi:hypothetical protein